jgi:ribosomal-protein-alanine N-acetyltransferase
MLRTARLLLRDWCDDAATAFVAMGADPAMQRYLPPPDPDVVRRMRAHWREHGFGRFVVGVPGETAFAGIVGLSHVRDELSFGPAVEAAWRLAPAYWGRGYATEAARAAIDDGFYRLGLSEIVAFTVPANKASRRVMTRLGMTRDPAEDFDHRAFLRVILCAGTCSTG